MKKPVPAVWKVLREIADDPVAGGLTQRDLMVLSYVNEHGVTQPSQIAEALGIGFGAVSRLWPRLEAEGLIVRQRSTADSREVMVSPTANGERLQQRIDGILLRGRV